MKPLATELRPQTIDDIVGQTSLLQPNGIIRKMVEQKFVSNLIFYGPPGVGKTSFANALAKDLGYEVFTFNASTDKKDKIDKILAQDDIQHKILIIDEVHRMNQNKQDLLLEYMENGKIVCFFTTTENPYFTINPAIRSRSTILELKPLKTKEIVDYLKKKIANKEFNLKIGKEPLILLAEMSGGDLRVAINKMELLIKLYPDQKIDVTLIKHIFDSKANLQGSKYADIHHDFKSALQKSVRGSDVDASLY
jgi:putative ATPase